MYNIWLDTHFDEADFYKPSQLKQVWFKQNKAIEDSVLFNKIIKEFNLDVYNDEATELRKSQRKELKRIYILMFNMKDDKYITRGTSRKFKKWYNDIN